MLRFPYRYSSTLTVQRRQEATNAPRLYRRSRTSLVNFAIADLGHVTAVNGQDRTCAGLQKGQVVLTLAK
jgi:hypothetical protein